MTHADCVGESQGELGKEVEGAGVTVTRGGDAGWARQGSLSAVAMFPFFSVLILPNNIPLISES